MKKLFALASMLIICTVLNAQHTIKSDNISDFSTIDLAGNLAVELIRVDQDEDATFEATLENSATKSLDWGVKNGILSVRLKPGSSSLAQGTIVIKYVKLDKLKISAANVKLNGLDTDAILDVEMQAGATLGADIKVRDLNLKIAGNSAAKITGSAKYYTLVATSKSKVDTRDLECVDSHIDATSGAEVYVTASERLQMVADTGASIFYRGTPEILRSNTKLLGTINTIGK